MIETEPTMSISKIVNLMKSYTTYHIWGKISELFAETVLERAHLLDRWLLCRQCGKCIRRNAEKIYRKSRLRKKVTADVKGI